MFNLKEFKSSKLSLANQRNVYGGGTETGAHTREGIKYDCDWEDNCQLRCYRSNGSIDVYHCS